MIAKSRLDEGGIEGIVGRKNLKDVGHLGRGDSSGPWEVGEKGKRARIVTAYILISLRPYTSFLPVRKWDPV